MLAADRLGIPTDRIRVRWGDTDLIPSGGVTGGSRSLQIAGTNVADAADRVVKACAQIAASLLEASADDIVSGPSGVAVRGSPSATVTWEEISRIDPTALSAVGQFTQTGATFPFGTHVAVVEIDTETGAVELLEVVACDDAGVILHRQLADGQLHGGLAQGIAQALFEGVVYDDAGTLLTSTMLDYLVPSAADMPSFRLVALETPTPRNPLGAKGIGESGTIGATAAVHNAVIDALAVFGVEHLQMPLTPESIWRSIHAR